MMYQSLYYTITFISDNDIRIFMPGKRKKANEYSKRGCLSCKSSHVKCDEQLPKCSRCTRRNTTCEYTKTFKNCTVETCSREFSPMNKESVLETSSLLPSPRNVIQQKIESPSLLPTSKETFPNESLPSLNLSSNLVHNPKTIETNCNIFPGFGFDNLLLIDSEYHKTEDYKTNTHVHWPNIFKHGSLQNNGPLLNYISTIAKNDALLFAHSTNFNNQKFLDFIWTMCRITKYFFVLSLFPNDFIQQFGYICFQLKSNFPILQTIITYHVSLHMVRLYKIAGYEEAYTLWRQIEVVSFHQCIEYLKTRLESATTFVELVVLTFNVSIIFLGNISNSSWQMHLSGCCELINKCYRFLPDKSNFTALEVAAFKLFTIIVDWYKHISSIAMISSHKRFVKVELPFSILENKKLDLSQNDVSYLSGNDKQLDDFISLLCRKIELLDSKGIHLLGLSCVVFAVTEQNPKTLEDVQERGMMLLQTLGRIQNQFTYKRINSNDFELDLTLKMCNLTSFQGLHLYLKFFFMGERDPVKIHSLLRDLLDSIYSMPYKSSCAISRHWILFISALIALIQNEIIIYEKIVEILKLSQANGMEVQSISILEDVRCILEKQTYNDLLSAKYDVVIC